MLRKGLVVAALAVVLVAVGGVAVARGAPDLRAGGPTSVTGTDATGVFELADRTVRQVRYDDGGTLEYTFTVTNPGRLPLTLRGLADGQPEPRLFGLVSLTGSDGAAEVSLGPGGSAEVTLSLLMGGCETLSARAGSFVSEVVVETERAGLFSDRVPLTLPEELHTGSPREAFCPEATAGSRPRG